jgi:hypothetical protein
METVGEHLRQKARRLPDYVGVYRLGGLGVSSPSGNEWGDWTGQNFPPAGKFTNLGEYFERTCRRLHGFMRAAGVLYGISKSLPVVLRPSRSR